MVWGCAEASLERILRERLRLRTGSGQILQERAQQMPCAHAVGDVRRRLCRDRGGAIKGATRGAVAMHHAVGASHRQPTPRVTLREHANAAAQPRRIDPHALEARSELSDIVRQRIGMLAFDRFHPGSRVVEIQIAALAQSDQQMGRLDLWRVAVRRLGSGDVPGEQQTGGESQ